MKYSGFPAAACLLWTLLAAIPMVALSGCGSSGGSHINDFPVTVVTRANEASFSQDALVLALRETKAPLLSAVDARRFDDDLGKIRSRVSAVNDIHARLEYTPKDLVVAVDAATPWLANWQAGTTATGDASVDSLLQQYDLVSVKPLLESDGKAFFTLTFGQTLNMVNFKEIVKAASSHFVSVEPNRIIGGGGNNIAFTTAANGRKYTFTKGSGDCPAGCINNHFWDAVVAENGSVTVTERDAP